MSFSTAKWFRSSLIHWLSWLPQCITDPVQNPSLINAWYWCCIYQVERTDGRSIEVNQLTRITWLRAYGLVFQFNHNTQNQFTDRQNSDLTYLNLNREPLNIVSSLISSSLSDKKGTWVNLRQDKYEWLTFRWCQIIVIQQEEFRSHEVLCCVTCDSFVHIWL